MDKREELILKVNVALIALQKIYPQFDISDSHTKETGRRIADTWIEMCKGYEPEDFEFTTFADDSYIDPIVLKDIEFNSFCAHHFLPFSGKVSIGYFPDGKICGVSKLARVVDYLASKPQIQENFSNEIAMYINEKLSPKYVLVKVEAQHTCVSCRGIKSRNSKMTTIGSYTKSKPELDIVMYNILNGMFKDE